MVPLQGIQASNSQLGSALPDLVAVFVGATSGIGGFTLKQLARHARAPRIYFTGRSQEAGEQIAAECTALNAEGTFIFIKADTSLLRNVDEICRDIKAKERAINILFLSAGTLIRGQYTPEGLDLGLALKYYCRARFIANLLPLLQKATCLRRVVSVAAGTKEGPVDVSDLSSAKNLGVLARHAHFSSFITLSHAAFATKAPEVSFVHDYPGPVKTGIFRGSTGMTFWLVRAILRVIGPLIYIPSEESGERHLFLATSMAFPAATQKDITRAISGVPLVDGIRVARGIDGREGSGVYSIDQSCESAKQAVVEVLTRMGAEGVQDRVWGHTEEVSKRIIEEDGA
ncbi:Retinol dehydrogenase 11 [Beauveria bassiana]|nr:Retinol dehydrogenase 11 [Beauveria bassiana]KAH8715443.1 Oxidoreductase andH [Beauveria bassiana]